MYRADTLVASDCHSPAGAPPGAAIVVQLVRSFDISILKPSAKPGYSFAAKIQRIVLTCCAEPRSNQT
jgi:hypothetical protein